MQENPAAGLTEWFKMKISQSLRLYRKWWKELSIGVFVRVLTLTGILWAAIANPFFPDVNDMNELITNGIWYMFNGLNPYNRPYHLSALGVTPQDWYMQNFLNYGPMNLLLHLPCMIYPWFLDFSGSMNLQPSFMMWHGFFDFLMFDRLMRMKHRSSALVIWWNPIMVTLNLVTHMSVPLFLLLMGYEQWKNPFQSVFWLGLGAITYQYIALLLVFAFAYHIRSYQKVLLGLLPALLVVGFFQIWATLEGRPLAMINDLILEQFGRSYEPWFPDHAYSWYTWTGSIPAIIFNVYNILLIQFRLLDPTVIPPSQWMDPLQALIGIKLSLVMNAFALGVAAILMVFTILRHDYRRSILYSVIAMGLVLLSSPSGIWHHNFIIIIPFFFLLSKTGAGYFYRKTETSPN